MSAESVADRLGDPKREGQSWRARCPVHGGRSLILSDGRDGTLLWNCKGGCSQQEVGEALADLELLEKRESRPSWSPQAPGDPTDHLAYAEKIWRQASSIRDTLAERYLRARGYSGPLKKALRFHPDLWHSPSRKAWPALLAKVTRDGEFVGVQRTYLAWHNPTKAPLGKQTKMTLGRVKGGAVRLGKVKDKLLLGEGIETTLAASQLADMPGWAVLGAWNFDYVQVPNVGTVIIAADHDEHNQTMENARHLRIRLMRRGIVCHIVAPPEPGTDWADVILGA